MTSPLPEVTHVYQNHTLDSTTWRRYVPRPDDIVISTSLKSGTTWMQAIVAYLILGTEPTPNISAVSPWLDNRFCSLNSCLEQLESQTHRRFIKTHLPLDGLPFYPQVKYIVVGRDARDVFMSLYNHHTHYTEAAYVAINDRPGRVGPAMPSPHQELHTFWRDWITRGWFEWECEGYPYWGNLHHTRTWWQYRHLENILFVHYNDLLRDLRYEVRRVADFLDIACTDERLAQVVQAVTFSAMKERAEQLVPGVNKVFEGGAQTLIHKGTNGRWKEVLSPDELALYAETAAKVLTPACAAWLEHGRVASSVLESGNSSRQEG